jgi:hypothetical protein
VSDGGGFVDWAILTERLVLRPLLLERLGFRCEARLVEADWFKGEWTTLRIYGLLAPNGRPRRHADTTGRPRRGRAGASGLMWGNSPRRQEEPPSGRSGR